MKIKYNLFSSLKKISLAISFSILIISCSDIKTNNIEYIVYGVYCGECSGNCATMYKLNRTCLIKDTLDNYFYHKTKLDNGFINGDTLSKREFDLAKTLIDEIPLLLRTTWKSKYGNPDDHDQCGVYLQIKSKYGNRIITIDTDLENIPPELRDYTKRIMKITGQFD